ncbi:MAG: DUF3626 domain-containing protein [Desulfovibrio sp.]|nr:DUF3626 domain-containing protein [Desulfovibrio sp.]
MSQISTIHADKVVQQELQSRGVDNKVGVFGEHKVQIGKGLPIRLDQIKVPSLPYAGFFKATQVTRGKAGVEQSADDLLRTLTAPGIKLDAGKVLSALKAGQTHFERLNSLGQLTQGQRDDTMWMFTKSVEKLSNADLAAVYQSFTSAEMDLLQTALQREGQINPDARDARMAASRLFDLQALVLKEVSNRSSVGVLEDLRAQNPADQSLDQIKDPKSLSDQWGSTESAPLNEVPLDKDSPLNIAMDDDDWNDIINAAKNGIPENNNGPVHQKDISSANLLTLVEVSARSATNREKTSLAQTQRLESRKIQGVSVKEMADVMRNAELTYNLEASTLINFIIANPDEPINNIWHLAEKGIKPKGDEYLKQRDAVEKQLFPELEGHEAKGDERPVYGAINITKNSLGPTSALAAYGDSCIVFKPSVSKRSTYLADDTFYSPRLAITPERKEKFYSLLDSSNLPPSLVTVLKDENSQERKDLEAWFDHAVKDPNANIHTLDDPPLSIVKHFKTMQETLLLTALMPKCFVDKDATRNNMATYDNLENLVVNLDNINGNALANAALKNRQGGNNAPVLTGLQYIEAQIHGPVVPSRDISEIRVNLPSLPGKTAAEKAESRRKLEEFGQRNGVKITFLTYDEQKVKADTDAIKAEQKSFGEAHVDEQKLNSLTQSYTDNFEQRLQEFIAKDVTLPPEASGLLRLGGEALRKAKEKFWEILPGDIAELKGEADLSLIFEDAMNNALHLDLTRRANCLKTILDGTLKFDGEQQKTAFISWVNSSTSLQNSMAVKVVHAQATAQAALFREIAQANPPLKPQEIFRRMKSIAAETRKIIDEANSSENTLKHMDADEIAKNAAYVTRLMLQSGEPPLDGVGLLRVFEALNRDEVQLMAGQLTQVSKNPEIVKTRDAVGLSDVASSFILATKQLAAYLNRAYDEPSSLQNISMMPQSLRDTVKELAPQAGEKMDEICPAYIPFPKPARPESLPSTEPERRKFLVKTLDRYMEKEKTGGDFTHGRGHIVRSYIFSNAMCNILAEQGVPVDRNAVLCGITCHDLGREGRGEDLWEAQSAQLTVETMRNEYGQDSMGEDYQTSVGNCIQRGNTETMEGMLLKSADSLDIGRTADFEEKYFPFLADKDPNKGPREPDKYTVSSPKVKALREELIKEAKILELITDPATMHNDSKIHLMSMFSQGSLQQQEFMQQQYYDILADIENGYKDGWKMDSDTFVQKVEDIVLQNADLFPVLSKYYRKN